MPSELNAEGGARFARRLAGGLDWTIREGVEDLALLRILEDPDRAFEDPGSLLKAGRSSAVARCSPFVVKRFHQKRAWNRVLDRFRLDRGRRNLVLAAELESLGIRTPAALAAAPRTRFGLVSCSYLIMAELPEALTLVPWLEQGGSEAALGAVGSFLARLHADGQSHRDLKATNVLVDSGGRPYLVDLDGIRKRTVTPRRRAADLSRLFRDLSACGPRSQRWIEAVFASYERDAPRPVGGDVRALLGFAAPNHA